MNRAISFLKSHISATIACLIYLFTCLFLYYVEYQMYGGAVKTGLLFAVVIPPLSFVSWLLRDEKAEEPKSKLWKKLGNIFDCIFLIVFMIFLGYTIYTSPYDLYAYYCLVLVLGVLFTVWFDKKKKINKILCSGSMSVIIVYSVILVVTIIYIPVANICTVKTAKTSLENEGFNNISLVHNYDSHTVSIFHKKEVEKLTKNEQNFSFYYFTGEKQNNTYGIFISTVSGKIVAFDLENKYSVLNAITSTRFPELL